MDEILERLLELSLQDSGSDVAAKDEVISEAQALWRTLETLVATSSAHELRGSDPMLLRLLACMRLVLQKPEAWRVHAMDKHDKGVYVHANRVRAEQRAMACRGEAERDLIMREGFMPFVVSSMESQLDSTVSAAVALQVLHTLAFDAKHRPSMDQAGTVVLCLTLMKRHNRELAVLLPGCKFLQYMAYDDGIKHTIAAQNGLTAVVDALRRFPNDVALATSATDLIYFLSMDLDAHVDDLQRRNTMIENIVDNVAKSMRIHLNVEDVQTHGIAILNSLAKLNHGRKLIANKSVLEICHVAIDVSDEARTDAIDLLNVVLSDQTCWLSVRQRMVQEAAYSSLERDRITQYLLLLQGKLLAQATNTADMKHISDRIQLLLSELGGSKNSRGSMVTHRPSLTPSSPTSAILQTDEAEEEIPMNVAAAEYEASTAGSSSIASSPRSPGDHSGGHGGLRFGSDDDQSLDHAAAAEMYDDSDQQGVDLPSTAEKNSPTQTVGYFERFLNEESRPLNNRPTLQQPNKLPSASLMVGRPLPFRVIHNEEASDESDRNWKRLYETSSKELKALRAEYHMLQENYKIITRRAQEQSKLLNIQNSRIKNHMEVHQQVLDRLRTLEAACDEANRKHQVERELRLAEVAQSEKISNSLYEAMKEIKALNSQNSSTSRELMQREKLRVDFQQKASEVKQMKQKLELERDEAVVIAHAMKFEQTELNRRLEECRCEGLEALRMREEDVDAPRYKVFHEVLGFASPPSQKRATNYMLTTKRVAGSPEKSKRSSVPPAIVTQIIRSTSPKRNASFLSGGNANHGTQQLLELARQNNNEDPETVDRHEIERSLRELYESFEASSDGNGVHVAIVRRFFSECGIIQSPMVAGDVDMILAKVLNQAHENRKKVVVRKDYAFAATAPPVQLQVDVKRFRYFDEETFFEAVTLVGMRRYPRLDTKRVLQTVVAEYVHPIQRRLRAASMVSARSGGRSQSLTSLISGASPVAATACFSVMKAILNGLALHIGRGNEHQIIGGDDEDEHLQNAPRKHTREDVLYSMLEMHSALVREHKPISAICDFYSTLHHNSALKDDLLNLSFELVLNFAIDFDIIPSFMDRLSLKHIYSEIAGYVKSYLALYKKFPHATDSETIKSTAFNLVLARLAIELFRHKPDYETPEKQICGLLQWLDNSAGREKIMRKAIVPPVIRFSRKLYTPKG
ncbi:TPA: hypothetical protein N0F65_010512 [Lagenidium giganteum]|uniref:Uncharacterized protein n=1 Tax=Lagenidium giganteum TaxID=4803 RepID=A0AAV2ZAQ5_9STRA|nr:TPA: hypothetical protein N0F65_010512 [Lagenidium giganteum]